MRREMSVELDEDNLPEYLLKTRPLEPLPEDCCGSGCSLCVFDIFDQELKIWRKECLNFLDQQNDRIKDSMDPILSQDCYSKFVLASVTSETKNCNIYRFTVPSRKSLNLKFGQHLILRGQANGKPVCRQYTPISPLNAKGHFDIIIKIYETGIMSHYVSQLLPGAEVEWRGPFGGFDYERNSFQKIFFIVAGTGIAPMIPLIHSIVEDEDDETFLRMLFACRTYDDILLKSIVNHFRSFWNFTVRYFLSQEPDCGPKQYGEDIYYGRINRSILSSELTVKEKSKILICGPVQFNKDIEAELGDLLKEGDSYFIF